MPALPDLTPTTADVAAGRYTPRAAWSPAQRATYEATLAALAGPTPRRPLTLPPAQLAPLALTPWRPQP